MDINYQIFDVRSDSLDGDSQELRTACHRIVVSASSIPTPNGVGFYGIYGVHSM